jgi:drug/metabolite transporter (DMT)-like permease
MRRSAPDASGIEPPSASPVLVLFVSVLAMSWAAPLIRFSDAPALAISFWRLAFSLPLIGAMLMITGEWRELPRMARRDLLIAACAGVFLAAHFVTWIASVALTSVAASVALVSTQPVWVALFGVVFLSERPLPRHWIGIGVAVCGAAVIGWGDWLAGPDPLRGDLLALMGAVFVAAYYVIGRTLRQRTSLWPYVAVVYGFATIALLGAMLATGTPLAEPYLPADWMVFLGLAIGPMLIGHTGQNWALRYLPAYAVNLTLLGEPVGATLIAWMLPAIAEVPPTPALAGGALILTGIVLGLRRR